MVYNYGRSLVKSVEAEMTWKEQTIKNTSEAQFRVEFECEFLDLLIH